MTPSINKGIVYMLGAQAMLAIMAACVKGLDPLPIMQIVFLRSITGMILITLYMFFFNISCQGKQKSLLILRGIMGLLALASYYYAITNIALSTATLLANIAPFFVTLLAAVFLKEPITLRIILIICLSLIGVFFLIQPEFKTNIFGYSIGIIAAVFIAFSFLTIRKLKNEHSSVVVLYFVITATLGSAPWALTEWVDLSINQWYLVLLIAVSSFFGQIWLTNAFKHGHASVISAAGYSGPLFCWVLGVLLFDEVMTKISILGALIILISGVVLALFAKKPKRKVY